jgi:hypothetical protein
MRCDQESLLLREPRLRERGDRVARVRLELAKRVGVDGRLGGEPVQPLAERVL